MADIAGELEWYALKTVPQKEFVAQTIIRRHGFTTYLPVERRWRRRNKYTREKRLLSYALFPRYLLIGFTPGQAGFFRVLPQVPDAYDPSSHEIRFRHGLFVIFNLPVITGVVGIRGEPRPLNASAVARLVNIWPNGLERPKEEKWMPTNREFKEGDMVRITGGPMESMIVPVIEIKARSGKAKILADLFGSNMEVEIALHDLEAA